MNFKFKKKAKIESDGFWMDLESGYINFDQVLENKEDIKKLNDAVELLKEFQKQAENKKVLKYY